MTIQNDWAQKLIEEIHNAMGNSLDNAMNAFCEAYKNGDSLDAYKLFVKDATVYNLDDKGYCSLVVFNDGSCYADWKQGFDRFYPSVQDLAAEDNDVSEIINSK